MILTDSFSVSLYYFIISWSAILPHHSCQSFIWHNGYHSSVIIAYYAVIIAYVLYCQTCSRT
jgi:hypothetical protein